MPTQLGDMLPQTLAGVKALLQVHSDLIWQLNQSIKPVNSARASRGGTGPKETKEKGYAIGKPVISLTAIWQELCGWLIDRVKLS